MELKYFLFKILFNEISSNKYIPGNFFFFFEKFFYIKKNSILLTKIKLRNLKKMTIKDKLWIFSLIAGIFAIISILAPAWGVIVPAYSFFVWFWGLEVSTDMGIRFLSGAFLTYGIICTILILIGGMLLIFISISYMRQKKKLSYVWIVAGVLIIISSIIYVVGLEIEYPGLIADENHSTALIGPFISGIMAILSEVGFLRLNRK